MNSVLITMKPDFGGQGSITNCQLVKNNFSYIKDVNFGRRKSPNRLILYTLNNNNPATIKHISFIILT